MTLTLYAFVGRAMEIEIQRYLRLSIASNGFTAPLAEVDIDCKEDLVMLAAGRSCTPEQDTMLSKL
jgi:hypothetical protein